MALLQHLFRRPSLHHPLGLHLLEHGPLPARATGAVEGQQGVSVLIRDLNLAGIPPADGIDPPAGQGPLPADLDRPVEDVAQEH